MPSAQLLLLCLQRFLNVVVLLYVLLVLVKERLFLCAQLHMLKRLCQQLKVSFAGVALGELRLAIAIF